MQILSDLDKHFGGGAISPSHVEHYFKVQRSAGYEHMHIIFKKCKALLIFKKPIKTEYTEDWYEVDGSFYEGDVSLQYVLNNNYNFLSFLNIK